MADRFIEQSKEIANNFIQNIVFIDDKHIKVILLIMHLVH